MQTVTRLLASAAVTAILALLAVFYPMPLWNLLFVFTAFITVSTGIRWLYVRLGGTGGFGWLERGWAVAVTFTFITFTRLFFRSGSNLDPAVANETAWQIARNMVTQIGSTWNADAGEVIAAYRNVFSLFVLGMLIHWLPERLKRRYRIVFARLPLPLIWTSVVITVFIVYQFVTAEMQPFIYFQF